MRSVYTYFTVYSTLTIHSSFESFRSVLIVTSTQNFLVILKWSDSSTPPYQSFPPRLTDGPSKGHPQPPVRRGRVYTRHRDGETPRPEGEGKTLLLSTFGVEYDRVGVEYDRVTTVLRSFRDNTRRMGPPSRLTRRPSFLSTQP